MGDPLPGSRDELNVVFAGLALAGNSLQLAGVYWDVGWHHARGRETFWSPPHMLIYAGVALSLLAAAVALLRRPGWGRLHGLAALGPMAQIVAAPIDELWHRLFGQDVSVWSPPHLLGIAGGMVGVFGWLCLLGPLRRGDVLARRVRRFAVAFFLVLLLAGGLFALGEFDHDQASRGPGLYPALVGLLVPWILVASTFWLDGRWAGTLVSIGYTLVRLVLAVGVWGIGLPWMGVPPQIVAGAMLSDLMMERIRSGVAGAAFGLTFTASDYPLTVLVSARSWSRFEWAATLLAAAAAGWASARLGDRIGRAATQSRRSDG